MHAKRDLSDCAKQLTLKLFDDYSHLGDYSNLGDYRNHISIKILLRNSNKLHFSYADSHKPPNFSGLHCASFFGIVEIIASLVEVGHRINQMDCTGSTPLLWAALNGHEGAVIILLRRGADPGSPDSAERTPLWWAAWNGHEGVVKILLGRDDVNPQKPDQYGKTPLGCAAENGHEGIVKILLGWALCNKV